jgi:hypothetical protein
MRNRITLIVNGVEMHGLGFRGLVMAGAAGLALTAASAEAAQTAELMPAFPTTLERTAVTQWLRERTGMPVGVPVEIGPDSALAILTDSTEGMARDLHAVTFREEGIQIGFVTRNGGRSLRGAGDVNCADRTFRSESLVVYLGSGLRGDRVVSFGSQTASRRPPADSVLERVVTTVCENAYAAANPRPAYVSPPVPRLPPVTAAAPAAPAPQPFGLLPARPPVASVSELPPLAAAAPIAPAPAPAPEAPQPEPVLPPAAEPPSLRPAQSLESIPAPPPASGPATVQIGAFGTSEQAFVALEALGALVPEALGGRSQSVMPTTVAGAELFRALVSGFADRDEARAFCVTVAERGGSCLVRP